MQIRKSKIKIKKKLKPALNNLTIKSLFGSTKFLIIQQVVLPELQVVIILLLTLLLG